MPGLNSSRAGNVRPTIRRSGNPGSIGPLPPAGPNWLAKRLDHVPADLLDDAEILTLRAWFARQRQDVAIERKTLEQLISLEPGRTLALTRLAEILGQAGETASAAALRRQKDELDAALDRYGRLYREDRFAEHLPELASLAELLGRKFEANGFWELAAVRDPANLDAKRALARLGTLRPLRSATSGTQMKLLTAELGPVPAGGTFGKRGGDERTRDSPI